mgnify:FL=1
MLNQLSQDTYYRVELRAHNAIGFSIPTHIYLKTSRGEGESNLDDKSYVYSASFESTSSSLKTKIDFCVVTLIILINSILVIFWDSKIDTFMVE